MRESDIENYLVSRVDELGGFTRKLQWVGRIGAPDRLVIVKGKVMFIELKSPTGDLRPHQAREIARMKAQGALVEVVNSKTQVDEVLT